MSVRVLGALGFILAAMTGGAQASSFVFPGIATSTPSVIRVGGSEPIRIATATTPSIVAFSEPDVTYEKVAAIPEKPRHGQNPMIIRGGIVGGAFAAPAPARANAAAAPAAEKKPGAGTTPAGTATASNGKPEPQPAATPQPATPGTGKVK